MTAGQGAGDSLPAATLVIRNIGLLATAGAAPPLRGAALGSLRTVADAAVAVAGETIAFAGAESELGTAVALDATTEVVDAHGALATPGLVDCHAHLAFAGDRAEEFDLRNSGVDYETLHRLGGGIARTVALTRTSLAEGRLDAAVRRHLRWMLAAGTTTAEAKSGYGLSVDDELSSLRCIRAAAADSAVTVLPTALAAHTVPAEYAGRADAYVDEVAIPAVRQAAQQGLATAADVFLERGSFDATQARRYLEAAAEAGLLLRLHGDQFSESGAIPLAVGLEARSVDHLEATGSSGVSQLAASNTAAVLLPLSALFLRRPHAPGRALVDEGAIVAVASDFNPGSSYGESLTLAMSLACVGCGLTASEALSAVTANAAWVLGVHERAGRLEPGMRADVLLFGQPDVRHLAYHVGSPALQRVFVGGREARLH